MSARRTPEDGDEPSEEFRSGLEGVEPLAPSARQPRQARRVGAEPKSVVRPSTTPDFVHPDAGEPRLGHVPGFEAKELARLRRGELRPERTLDLHGLHEPEALRLFRSTVRECAAQHVRALLVVHGRGRGSGGTTVLRSALPEWLASPGVAERVLAFTPAAARDGGEGATLLWLRREIT